MKVSKVSIFVSLLAIIVSSAAFGRTSNEVKVSCLPYYDIHGDFNRKNKYTKAKPIVFEELTVDEAYEGVEVLDVVFGDKLLGHLGFFFEDAGQGYRIITYFEADEGGKFSERDMYIESRASDASEGGSSARFSRRNLKFDKKRDRSMTIKLRCWISK